MAAINRQSESASISQANDWLVYDELQPDGTYVTRKIHPTNLGFVAGGTGGGLIGVISPEGAVTANPGTTYFNTADGSFWIKTTGTGNTGWLALLT